jgi:hypothetical protein
MNWRPTILLAALLPFAMPLDAVRAQSPDKERLATIERRLDTLENKPAGWTVAQASDSDRITAIERRLDALEQRLGKPAPPQAQSAPSPRSPTAAVQLPGGAIQQVPQATLVAPTVPAAQASYRTLGLRKGLTEAEVVNLLGPPVRVQRGVVDVYFYGKSIEPNVNFQYGRVIDWTD